ncbi:L-seryl-tRNA(Sec) kinase [Culex pipiens pallens]|uniref:L-seryl-tRNA(Sec) kinase n=1 Tax=Culex pipiens pallens TaxID=42434 RepID=UPI0019547B36|nr:L-seryl-tRNA(Sec) kinase [Culex pipiens pallens]
MNKVCLNVLVGVPGAGKTTFCQRILDCLILKESSIRLIHICFDDFIKFDAKIDLENSFKGKRKRLLELLEEIIQSIKTTNPAKLKEINHILYEEFQQKVAIDLAEAPSNYLILIDDNMYYRSMRYQVFQIARRLGTGYFQTYFEVSLESAKSSNSKRSNAVPEEVISRMFYKLEKPDERICRWEKNTVILRNSSDELDIILNTTLNCLERPVEPLEAHGTKNPVEQSFVHKVDLLLRKVVGEMIKQQKEMLNSGEVKLLAEGLLSKRKLLLEDFRAGLVEIDPERVTGEQIQTWLQ